MYLNSARNGGGKLQLNIENVGKQYRRDFWGLCDFSLSRGSGVLGLLGPNGADKSTLMRILATITQATEGKVTWNGMDNACQPDELRKSSVISCRISASIPT